MAAFRLGLEQGADGIELDVHVSADGVPVVIHDATLERTTSGVGKVSEVSAALILDAVARGGGVRAESHVPALRDVLAWLPGDRGLVLDVKAVAAVEPTIELLEAARRASPGVTRLISFLPEAIELPGRWGRGSPPACCSTSVRTSSPAWPGPAQGVMQASFPGNATLAWAQTLPGPLRRPTRLASSWAATPSTTLTEPWICGVTVWTSSCPTFPVWSPPRGDRLQHGVNKAGHVR